MQNWIVRTTDPKNSSITEEEHLDGATETEAMAAYVAERGAQRLLGERRVIELLCVTPFKQSMRHRDVVGN